MSETQTCQFPNLRSVAMVLLIMMGAGWTAAGTPMQGDQALFLVGAKQLSEGDVLYRDFWDVTNPGIYLFYSLAGKCFGFTEDGVHLGEWFYWLAFVSVVCEVIRREYQLRSWPIAPAFLIGVLYYFPSCSDASQLTKVEGLVAFPLFLAIWFASRMSPRIAFLAGLAGGFVILFKFLFGACLAVGWGYLLLVQCRRNGFRSAFGSLLAIIGGVGMILGLLAVYFLQHNAFEIAQETIFRDPPKMLAEVTLAPFDRMVKLVRWGLELFTPIFVVAVFGSWLILRSRHDAFVVAYGLVIASSFAVILVQRWSWWTYHILLISTPSCVLVAYVLPHIRIVYLNTIPRFDRIVISLCSLGLFLPVIGHGARAYRPLLSENLGLTANDRSHAKTAVGNHYPETKAIADWLIRENAEPGPIYVCGDPLIYLWSGRRQAVPIHGWSMELYHAGTRLKLERQLREALPPYIYVSRARHGYDELIANKYPDLQQLLETQYIVVPVGKYGSWYKRRIHP